MTLAQEDEEASYKQRFPDHFHAFADVAQLEDMPNLGDDSAVTAQALPEEGLTEAEASSNAAQQLLHGDLLSDLVHLHSRYLLLAYSCFMGPHASISLPGVSNHACLFACFAQTDLVRAYISSALLRTASS